MNKIQVTKVDKMPISLFKRGVKGESIYQDLFDVLGLAEVGDVFKFGPWSTTKEAASAQTAVSHYMKDNGMGYKSAIRNNKGNRITNGDAPFVFVEKRSIIPTVEQPELIAKK